MANSDDRPQISFAPESFPPRFLAGSFAISVSYPTPAAAAAGASPLVHALTTNLAGAWHVEYEDYHGYVAGKIPANPGWRGTGFLLGFTPIIDDPADENARGLRAEILAGILTSFGTFPEAVLLPDWALTPTRRALGLVGSYGWLDTSNPAAFAKRADAYAVLRAARAKWISPWIDGARPVRNLDAFRELHADMPPDEALLVAGVWGRGNIVERQPVTDRRLSAAIDGLAARGWIERQRSPYNKDIYLVKTRRFSRRLPAVEALAY